VGQSRHSQGNATLSSLAGMATLETVGQDVCIEECECLREAVAWGFPGSDVGGNNSV